MKHTHQYRYYEIPQDLINFLKGDDVYAKDERNFDKQIYSHYGSKHKYSDKYIGIIIEWQDQKFFAPLTHDADKKWFNRSESCDFEMIYNNLHKYLGSILLCKALPLTTNLAEHLSLEKIFKQNGEWYGRLCKAELDYLNSPEIHQKLQDKMQQCIYGAESPYRNFRVDYALVSRNVAEYNAMLLAKAEEEIKRLKNNK